MELSEIKSLNKASEKQLLQMVLSTQLQILRKLEFLECEVKGKTIESHAASDAQDMISKIDTFKDLINEQLGG